jgi:DMSO/TMAO reductase YedYZ molybdopterin-dependent catalytic subunit
VANADAGAYTGVDGTLKAHATHHSNPGHLFFVGEQKEGEVSIRNFELTAVTRGVPLSRVLLACGLRPSAVCVCFHTFDSKTVHTLDLLDALHPQTLLTYGMNGRELMIRHGGPLRLRVENQIGYKSRKYLQKIVVKDVFDDGGKYGIARGGWAWYAGI